MAPQADRTPGAAFDARTPAWGKTDIIHFLADLHGYRSYLEIATRTTGNEFARIDRSRFQTCHRLMYRCPDGFDDGLNIDFRARGPNTGECIAAIKARGLTYDIMLVDSYHDRASSYRDIADALGLMSPGGTIVVHDCLPPLGVENIVSPTYVPGEWCGVTFMAFVDFVTRTGGIDYTTVDTDYGCGIIQKSTGSRTDARPARPQSWRALGEDPEAALRLVHEHKTVLLHIASVDDFVSNPTHKAGR